MTQMSFNLKIRSIGTEKILAFKEMLKNVYRQIETSLPDRVKREQILTGGVLTRDDIEFRKKPETVTEDLIVIPVLEFLGFVKNKSYYRFTGATESESQKECDLTLLTEQERILVESEPMGKNLFHKNVGVDQLTGYLENKSFRSGIGIATNGFRWILVKYNDEVFKSDIVRNVDLLPVFKRMGGLPAIEEPDDLLNDFLATFSRENIINVVRKQELQLTISKERVSKRFYDDYIMYVFGIGEKNSHNYCLLDAIEPAETDENIKRSFAVTLMNRLIFIKFLEDRVLKRSNLLKDLLDHYNSNKRTIPSTFYKTFLSPLFYDVFNTNVNKREENTSKFYLFENIPYLNGGLFRESIKNEKSLNVRDDILQAIITNLLVGYTFNISLKDLKPNSPEEEFNTLDPDILGYVFEKTINFLTAPGEKETRKLIGAYYTPDAITNHISTNAIFSVVMEKLREGLKESGWTDSDISKYQTVSDLAKSPPLHPETLKKLGEKIDSIKILDPACGSGHFLTSALKLIVFIKRKVFEPSSESVDVYELKRRAISQNLYGVDIEAPAVEIAKLRLWLSLIEELNIDNIGSVKTLPNIEYNVVHGDSLIGWNDESMLQMVAHEVDLKEIRDKLSGLEIAYVDDVDKYKLLKDSRDRLAREFPHLEDLKKAYTSLKRIYSEEQGERAVLLKGILETVRSTIYSVVTPTFENYIKAKFNGNSRNREMARINNPIHWSLDFNEAFEKGGFDIIIGNPPYGASFGKSEKDYLKAKYTSSKGNGNSAMMFIERSISLLRPGGHLGFIVPKSLAFSQKWEDGRNFILGDLNSVLDVSKAFKYVKLEQMIVDIKKGSKSESYALERTDAPTKLYVKKKFVTSTQTILLAGSKDEIKIFEKLNRSRIKFGNVTDTNRGLPLQSKLNKNNEGLPVLRGEDISRFYYKTPSVFLKSEEVNGRNEAKRMRESPKIVSQRIVAHVKKPVPHILIMAAVDRNGMISVDTVENTYLRDKEYSLDTLCAIMNSRLVEWYAYRFIFANAIRSMDLDRYYVSKIPLPLKASNLRTADGLVSELSMLKGSDCTMVDTDLLDKINKAIYKAYGLSTKEGNLIDSLTVN